MRRSLVVLLSGSLCACPYDFGIPDGGLITCESDDDCVTGLCDPELKRCVNAIVLPPEANLTVDRVTGPRSQSFVFDATGSTDPAGLALTFRWEVEGSPGDASDFDVDTGSTGLLPVTFVAPPSAFKDGVLVRTVQVRVTNAAGRSAERTLSVVIQNHAPTADFGEDLFVSELQVQHVTLDVCGGMVRPRCTVSDVDENDTLSFTTWTQVRGTPQVTWLENDAGVARFVPPADWARPLVFETRVSDGISESRGQVRVYRSSHAWVGLQNSDHSFRVHPDFHFVPGWQSGAQAPRFRSVDAIASDGDGGFWFGDSIVSEGGAVLVHVDGRLTELERMSWPQPVADALVFPSLVAPRGSTPGCAAYRARDGGFTEDFALSAFLRFSPGGNLFDVRTPLDSGFVPAAVYAGPAADCWAVSTHPQPFMTLGAELGRLDPAGQLTSVRRFVGHVQSASEAADGTLWLTERRRLPDAGFVQPGLGHYSSSVLRFPGQGPAQEWEIDAGYVLAVAARDEHSIWLSDQHGAGLWLFDDTGRMSRASTRPVRALVMAFDRVDRALWVVDMLGAQLFRFSEREDGGLVEDGVVTAEDLPAGINRKGFDLPVLTLDPRTGAVNTFVGQEPNGYHAWVTVPPHLKRTERQELAEVDQPSLRGDPTSGHLWLADRSALRRVDVKGRELVRVPYASALPLQPNPVPVLGVDRAGQAWLTQYAGGTWTLVGYDAKGQRVRELTLPGPTASMRIAGDWACGSGANGPWRAQLSTGMVSSLNAAPDTPAASAASSDGRCWVLTQTAANVWRALRFDPGATTPSASFPVESTPNAFVTSINTEPEGQLMVTTWNLTNAFSDLKLFTPNGTAGPVITLQDNNLGRGGIGLDAYPRRVCAGSDPSCLELWTASRLGNVSRYDTRSNLVEQYQFGLGEAFPFDLQP